MSDVNIELRAFSWDDLPAVVDLINRCEATDQLGRGTSEPELRTWWTSPGMKPERHAFLAVADGNVIGYGRIQLRAGDEQTGFSTFQCRGRVLPSWGAPFYWRACDACGAEAARTSCWASTARTRLALWVSMSPWGSARVRPV